MSNKVLEVVEAKTLPSIDGLDENQLIELQNKVYTQRAKLQEEQKKNQEKNQEKLTKAFLTTKEGVKLKAEYDQLVKDREGLTKTFTVKYDVPLTLEFDIAENDIDVCEAIGENWTEHFVWDIKGKIGKIEGASLSVAKLIQEQMNDILADACAEALHLHPETLKALRAFGAKVEKFEVKYREVVNNNLSGDWLNL